MYTIVEIFEGGERGCCTKNFQKQNTSILKKWAYFFESKKWGLVRGEDGESDQNPTWVS